MDREPAFASATPVRRRRPRSGRSATSGRRGRRRWSVLAALAAAAYLLGYFGYRDADFDVGSSLYHALQLFALEAPEVESPGWMLTVARFGAPAVAAAAAIETLYALFREQLQGLAARFLARDHVIVAGLGAIGYGLAVSFHDTGLRVVVVEQDPGNPSIAGCRQRGMHVVTGDATDPSVLESARLRHARYLILTCGDDAANLDVMAAAAGAVPQPEHELSVLVHIADGALWRRLQAEALTWRDEFPFRVDCFNVLDAAARVMFTVHPPFSDGAEHPHLLFIGLDDVGEAALLRAAGLRDATRGAERVRITLVGSGMSARLAGVLARHPELEDVCELAVIDLAPADARFQRGEIPGIRPPMRATAVYVFLENEAEAVTAALVLHAQPGLEDVPAVVTMWQAGSGAAQLLGRGQFGHLTAFNVLPAILRPDLLVLGTEELLARLRHSHYVSRELARGQTPDANPSLVPWEELPPALKESNRAFARGIGEKLAASDCTLVPAPLAASDDEVALFDEAEIERLARMEHERWVTDLRARGWRPTNQSKDPIRQLHPLLVHWDELGEDDRERDRDSIRSLPTMLAGAGLLLQRRDH
jgi:TrkA-N domain/RyR domain